ncbi:uncharacterized protein DS421_14g477030 [Arachis hypogaea]|nr:uncharacterized protein DS421_14g477030 [Arachis hypogaea]
MADSSTSSTSQSNSKKMQPFHFRAKFENQDIQLVANLRNLHQHTIKLSIKNLQRKQSYNTQGVTVLVVLDLLRKWQQETNLEEILETGYGSFKITPRKIGHALGINATGDLFPQKVDYKKLSEDDKVIFRRFQGKTLKSLTDEMMDIGVGNEEDRLMFKRIFILYIQMAFLLPTTIKKILPVHLAPIFEMDSITERNWGGHVLTFIVKGITDYKEKKKKAIDGCLFALMIIYFHLSKNKGKKRAERPPKPWIANWSKEQLVERMNVETEEILRIVNMAQTREKMKKIVKTEKKNNKSKKQKKKKASSTSSSEEETTTDSDSSTSESETQEDSEDSPRKHPSKKGKKMDSKKRKKSQEVSESESESTDDERYEISSEDLDELLRENDKKSAAEGENEADLRSTEGRYVSFETIPAVNLGSDDPSSQGGTEQSSVNKPAESMLSPVQQSASEPADSNMMVVREQTPSDALVIVPIQVFVPMSQTTTVPELEETPETAFEPTPLLQIEGTTETTPEPLQQLEETTPTLPPAPSKIHPDAEDVAALMMMARTASYVPKTDPVPSFSLGLTDSSQEEAATQEGASTMHLASLQAESYIESEIVSAMCLILNQKNDKRFQEQVYCLLPDIVNMALSKHPKGEFISSKTNKEFRVEDYPCFIPFIDAKKLTSHPYIFAPVCYSGHWWLWVIDTTKRRFHILDPLHKKAPSDERKQHNKFTVRYVISRLRAYAGGKSLKKDEKEKEIKASYVKISGQKSSYDCAIYVMKWLELIEPENIKKGKYEWDNWKQEEVDHYRVEYASRILFSEMNKERDQAIRESNAIRLSKPSSVLLSPFCQINSTDIETA